MTRRNPQHSNRWVTVRAKRGGKLLAWYRGKNSMDLCICQEQWRRYWPDCEITREEKA